MTGPPRRFIPIPEVTHGATLRVAVIDSGIAPGHPHVGSVAGGIALVGEDPNDTRDRLGHGTAVAAAILEKLPQNAAELIAVRVLDRELATTARILSLGIEWATTASARLINLSLATTNAAHAALFAHAVDVAGEQGAIVVSARGERGASLFPGSLRGVIGVRADSECPRFSLAVDVDEGDGWPVLVASPFPRPIDGVSVDRNLSGVSFAVANATGLLGRLVMAQPDRCTAADLLDWFVERS